MSFGAFMEGLQGGVKSGQSIRRERQMDDIYDAARRKIKNEEKADDLGRAKFGDVGDDSALGDPLGQKIANWFSGLFKGGDDAATAAPDPGAAALQDKAARVDSLTPNDGVAMQEEIPAEGFAGSMGGYASGGQPKFADGDKPTEEELRRQKAQRYGVTPGQLAADAGNAIGVAAKAIPSAARAGVHKYADWVEQGTNDPVGSYVEGAWDTPRVLFGQGIRAVGDFVGGDIPFYDETGGAKPQAVPTPAATKKRPSAGLPPGGRDRTSGQRAVAAAAIPAPGAAPAKAPEAPVMAPDVIKKIPWDKVDPMELPKFKTQDWVEYRELSARQMVMRGGGITVADAYDKVDQQVIAMQQRGTKALLQEAILRSQSGDLKGAGNALVQMFQYVPSGTDAVVGTYNGQLVAQFIDEQTGQPVGEPTPINAQMLGDLWQQYANPAAWAQMAQDRVRTDLQGQQLDLAKRTLEEVQIPAAQSDAEYRALLGKAAVTKAIGGGEDGLKPSEQLAIDEDVRKTVEKAVLWADEDGNPLHPQLQNPNIQTALLAAIMKMKRQTGKPSEEILLEILNAAKE